MNQLHIENTDYSCESIKAPTINCAIYTRKSNSDGLDQVVNSLDAQELTIKEFITSNEEQGWIGANVYKDGGYSGKDLNRPDIKRLIADVKQGMINLVIVYRIDRLTRDSYDYGYLARLFAIYGAKIISVSEGCNEDKPNDRFHRGITLNFAQFEREIASERIKHKIEVCRKQGIWTGGTVPLGYNHQEKSLIVNEKEAEIVRLIYKRFLEIESTIEVARELNNLGYTPKNRLSKDGKKLHRDKFHKQNIRSILQNSIYTGKIRHKENIYQGKHEAIIPEDDWNKVQSLFTRKTPIINKPVSRSTMAPILKGIIRCGNCKAAMTPTYTKKKNKHYCYYLCIHKDKGINDNCPIARLPAKQIEEAVTKQIIELLKQPELITNTILEGGKDNIDEEEIINYYQKIERVWEALFPIEQAKIIQALIKSIIVHENKLELNICAAGMGSLIHELKQENNEPSGALSSNNNDKIQKELPIITKFITIKKRGGKTTVIEPRDAQTKTKHYNDSIIKAIIEAYKYQQLLKKRQAATIKDIALKEQKSLSDIAKIYKLNYLDPNIVDAILEGTQPPHLSLRQLTRSQIPLLWQKQKEVFGFVE